MSSFDSHIQNHFKKRIAERNSRFYIQTKITAACELKCKHCYEKEAPPSLRKNMSSEVFFILIEKSKMFSINKGIPVQIMFIGGNPLLHPNFYEFADLVYKSGMTYIIKGNSITDKHTLKSVCELKNKGLEAYQISIDGMEEYHDWLRGEHSFKETIKTFYQLGKNKIPTIARITISEKNMEAAKQLVPLLFKIKVSSIGFVRSCDLGNYRFSNFKPLLPNVYRQFLMDMLGIYKKYYKSGVHFDFKDPLWFPLLSELSILSPILFSFNDSMLSCCSMRKNFIVVNPDGSATSCGKMPDSVFGNILSSEIDEIITNKINSPLAKIENYEKCSGCEYKLFCMGCQAISKSFLGSTFKTDPQCWL